MKQPPASVRKQFDDPLGTLDDYHRRLLYRSVIIRGLQNLVIGFVIVVTIISLDPHPHYATRSGIVVMALCCWPCYGLYQLLTFKNRAKDRVRGMLIAQYPDLKELEQKRKIAAAQKQIISPAVFVLGVLVSLACAIAAGVFFLS